MKDWLGQLDPKWVLQNIIGWGFLAAVLYFVAFHMILTTQEKTFQTMDRMVEIQSDLAKTQRQQTPILDRIDRNTSK